MPLGLLCLMDTQLFVTGVLEMSQVENLLLESC